MVEAHTELCKGSHRSPDITAEKRPRGEQQAPPVEPSLQPEGGELFSAPTPAPVEPRSGSVKRVDDCRPEPDDDQVEWPWLALLCAPCDAGDVADDEDVDCRAADEKRDSLCCCCCCDERSPPVQDGEPSGEWHDEPPLVPNEQLSSTAADDIAPLSPMEPSHGFGGAEGSGEAAAVAAAAAAAFDAASPEAGVAEASPGTVPGDAAPEVRRHEKRFALMPGDASPRDSSQVRRHEKRFARMPGDASPAGSVKPTDAPRLERRLLLRC